MAASQMLRDAVGHHQAGRFQEAESIYNTILGLNPSDADALNLLGILHRQRGNLDQAVDFARKAVVLQPAVPDFSFNLGEACRAAGEFAEAAAAYESALQRRPNDAEGHYAFGVCQERLGDDPKAVEALSTALRLNPRLTAAYDTLAVCLLRQERFGEALAVCRSALNVDQTRAASHFNLGAVFARLGDLVESAAAYQRAVHFKPGWAEAHLGLSATLERMGRRNEALAAAQRAAALDPASPEPHNILGLLLDKQGHLAPAEAAYRHAIARCPRHADAYSNLAINLKDQLDHNGALLAHRKSLELRPGFASSHSNYLLTLNYCEGIEEAELLAEHRRWSHSHAERFLPECNVLGRLLQHRKQRIRVGYVSPDLRDHPVAYFIEPLLTHHSQDQFEVFTYSDVIKPDAVTRRLQRLVPNWKNTSSLSDAHLAELIREDQVDLLVDLAGHTAGNRLLTFARRPAPVQITYLGYPNTTGLGLNQMQYRLTDAEADPENVDRFYTERLIRLPRVFLCYQPPHGAPEPAPPPCLASGTVTFGCFNQLAKVTLLQIARWADLLRSVPRSRLLMKNRSLSDPAICQKVTDAFERMGVGPERIELLGMVQDLREHLALYARVDVALDTFPYHGTTTTCEALWMGVPVITLTGQCHRSRVGASLLKAVGRAQWAASSPEDYVTIAQQLAGDQDALKAFRATLRDQVRSSPLSDGLRFTTELESCYRKCWQETCDKGG